MLMRDTEIKAALEQGQMRITPFAPDRMQGASYDLSIGGEALVSNSDQKVILAANTSTSLHLNAGDFALAFTKESVKLPLDMAGDIGMKSSLARSGLILLAGMQIDPGFEGHLRLGLYNASPRRVTLDYDDGLCMVEFHRLAGPVEHQLAPNADLIEGRIPKSDRDFLRSLETTSLSDLGKNVRTMSQSVDTLTRQMKWLATFLVPTISAILVALVAAIIKAWMHL